MSGATIEIGAPDNQDYGLKLVLTPWDLISNPELGPVVTAQI